MSEPLYTASNDYVIVRRVKDDKPEEKGPQTYGTTGLVLPQGVKDPSKEANEEVMQDGMARGTIVSVGPKARDFLYTLPPIAASSPPGYYQGVGYVGDLVLYATANCGPLGNGLYLLGAKHIIARIDGLGPKDL